LARARNGFLFPDAGLAAMGATHIASWPSNTKEEGITQMMPAE
jgi:hypothetical protein